MLRIETIFTAIRISPICRNVDLVPMTPKRGVRNRVYKQFDVVGPKKMAKLFGNVPP